MENEIRLSRRIAASPAEVFDAWTRADHLNQWFIPGRGATRAQLDARVGGRFLIEMIDGEDRNPHEGEYLRVERPHLLEFSWISKHTERKRSVVTVELKAAGADATDLTLTHRLLPNAEARAKHTGGWNMALDKLVERYVAARATA